MFQSRTNQPVPPPVPATDAEPVEAPNTGAPRKKILIVDDDPVILKTLSFTLQSQGYDVVTATEGAEAIGQVRDGAPDVLLVDVGLAPDLVLPWDGFQVAEWLRRISGKVPVIMISGADKAEYAALATATGAQAFFAKPIDNDRLLETIASALSGQAQTTTVVNN